jgi:glycosyltransferase involved in cell wall biosynthesis
LFVYADNGLLELNTSFWRCFIPAKHLEGAGHETLVAHLLEVFTDSPSPKVASFLHTAEVIVVERVFIDAFAPKILEWQKMGKRVVGTFDDAYHLIEPNRGSGGFWRGKKTNESTGNLKQFRRNLSLFDRVIVPSRVLAEDYKPYCKDIQFVDNYTLKELWDGVKKRPPDNSIVIGWGGSTGHVRSWRDSGVVTALARLQRKYPRLHVKVYGGGTEIPDYLKSTGIKYEFGGWLDFESWPSHVALWDIGVVPLSGLYDSRRSAIKALELGYAQVPWVATNDVPYQGAVGGTLVDNKPNRWEYAIEELIENKSLRYKLSMRGHEWAVAHTDKCVEAYELALGSW